VVSGELEARVGVNQAELWLAAYYPDGRGVSGEQFAPAFGREVAPYEVSGDGEPGTNARLDAFQLALEDYQDEPEPSEAFFAAAASAFEEFAGWLAGVPADAFVGLRREGIVVDAWIYLWIDQDQLELALPPVFLAELARLQLPLQLMSEGE
jgi:hypothetical protein